MVAFAFLHHILEKMVGNYEWYFVSVGSVWPVSTLIGSGDTQTLLGAVKIV